jgi:small-conductance mechanosensitive channel
MKRFVLAALLLISSQSQAQIANLLSPAAATSSASVKAAPAAPAAISIDQIAVEAEEDTSRVHEMSADLDDDETVAEVTAELAPLTRDANTRLAETRRTLSAKPSVASIRALEPGWEEIAKSANEATKELTRRATQLTHLLAELDKLDQTWDATLKTAQAAQAPQPVIDRINVIDDLIGKTRTAVAARQTEVLALQAKSASLAARADDTLDQLGTASQRATSQLLTRDSQPVWSGGFWSSAVAAVTTQGSESLRNQFVDLGGFFMAEPEGAGLHVLLFLVLIVVMVLAKKKLQKFTNDEPEMARAVEVFNAPVATALLVASFLGYWFYSDPPQLLPKLLSLIGIFATLIVVRRLIGSHLYPLLYALTGFYFLEEIRTILAVSAPIARLVFVVELLGLLFFSLWFYLHSRADPSEEHPASRTWRILHKLAGLAVAMTGLVLAANLVGYQGLSTLVGRAMLLGAYLALLLYALTRVAQGLVLGAFHVRPLTYLSMVRQHRRLLTDRITIGVELAAAALWVYAILRTIGFWEVTAKNFDDLFDANLTVGSFSISLGKVFGFVVALVLANWVARLINFVLDEEIYPKINLARGLPYVISTMLRYAILFIGVVIGLASLGIDMTKFTILAGAFSVGLGFGMQNIVNNFVSGLIVLFERPIKVGDVVQFGDIIGRVDRIGIRASIIRASNGAEIIIPNGTLIANNVTNWTFSSKARRVDVPIQAALVADPAAVKKLLLDVASKFPQVQETPAPQALLTALGPDALTFELRVWTDAASDWASLKSDITSSATEELRGAGIAFK